MLNVRSCRSADSPYEICGERQTAANVRLGDSLSPVMLVVKFLIVVGICTVRQPGWTALGASCTAMASLPTACHGSCPDWQWRARRPAAMSVPIRCGDFAPVGMLWSRAPSCAVLDSAADHGRWLEF
jgi:hypothetical protein